MLITRDLGIRQLGGRAFADSPTPTMDARYLLRGRQYALVKANVQASCHSEHSPTVIPSEVEESIRTHHDCAGGRVG
jgi:hypothetical protein